MIKKYAKKHPVSRMCRLLGVSSSGYYDWASREPSNRTIKNEQLLHKIKTIYDANKARSGAIRVTHALQQAGDMVGRHRVARLMRLNGLRAKAAKKFKATTNSKHRMAVADNLLKQNFVAYKPNEKYVTDITYIWTEEGWLYLAAVMDLYSRMLIGWCLSERMTTQLVIDALQMALWRRKKPTGVIVHSDRGSQYCAEAYQDLLTEHGLICSMSKAGDCYDNAAMESWNHSFKVEAIHGEKFKTRQEAKNHVFDYIEVYYNRQRLHSRLGYMSPEAFEAKLVA
jgi:transposase InsO family protein